jgi:hypothetical protein
VKHNRCVTMLAIAVCLAPGAVQRSYAQNKMDLAAANGTWDLNVAKSDFGKEAPPKSIRMILTGTGTARGWTMDTVEADGKSEKISYSGTVDGRFYPVKGDTEGSTFAYMKDGSFAMKDKSGKVVATSTWSLSADGKTMTVHMIVHTPNGDVTNTGVYQRAK